MDEVNKKTILIVEDEMPMQQALNDKITLVGLRPLHAKDGEEGLLVAIKEHPDLILLDILMPKMDGITMMKKLREDPWGKTVPVILLTNVNPDSDETIRAIIENQPAYYLIKSDIKLEDVLEKIKEVLKIQ